MMWRLSAMSSAKALAPLRLVELAQALDDRLLGREVAVEIAGAHAGFVGDMLHRRRVEAMADEGALGRFEDALAPLGVSGPASGGGRGQRHAGSP